MTSATRMQARLVVQCFSNEFEQRVPCVGMLRVWEGVWSQRQA